ncbi:MAG: MarR family winged helix-turn-helix transcriptional regulator [Anaerolineales bacterium]|nr:MarR family winged helix-turn-helix transcriptional regulator [Anaerolineales bacterium]MDW8447716.1 MarR family winged helix-turn-helix transcriptional regulator [Anaerolineales bacterium]
MKALNPRYRQSPSGQIAVALYRVTQAVQHLLRRRAEQEDLSAAQVQALIFLNTSRSSAHTVGGLAKGIALAYPTTSAVVDALERKELVERRPSESNRRTINLRLTQRGKEKSATLEDLLDEIEQAVQSLPSTEQQVLQRALQAIVAHLNRAGYIHLHEMCWHCQFFRRNAHPNDPRGPHHCTFMDAPLAEEDTFFDCPDFQLPSERR